MESLDPYQVYGVTSQILAKVIVIYKLGNIISILNPIIYSYFIILDYIILYKIYKIEKFNLNNILSIIQR